MLKIYISGKITGLLHSDAEENFKMAEDYLLDKYDCVVINPMVQVPYLKGKDWKEYMLDDIKLLFDCNCIYMLDNWTTSKGARIECSIAKKMGIDIKFQPSEDNELVW